MLEYRAFLIGPDGHFEGVEPIICADDEAAVAAAKRLLDRHDIEVWQGTRKVSTLTPAAD
jgi:hypothetical protein